MKAQPFHTSTGSPVPASYDKSAAGEQFSDGREYHVTWFGVNDVENIRHLVARISKYWSALPNS